MQPPLSHALKERRSENTPKIQLSSTNMPWREVLHLGTRCIFPKHHCEPGEKIRGFYFIAKGRVRLTYLGDTGKEKCALYMEKNCIFNEIPALSSTTVCASFFCIEEVEAWRFNAKLLTDTAFISKYPHLISNLLQSIAVKSGIFFSQSSEKNFSNSMHKLCIILMELYANPQLCLSQSEVAALLGIHLTTVARHIRTLRNQGVIGRFTKTAFEVLDIESLRLLAEYVPSAQHQSL